MDLVGMADPGFVPTDALTSLAFGIIRIVAFGGLGIVVIGFLLSCICDLFECRKWRQVLGRTETWQLMH